jgi:prepilin-type processing-associated H-X9-DG protein
VILAVVGGMILLVAVIGVLIALLWPAVFPAREAARRAMCINNMKQIGVAMQMYHDQYKCFPPAYIPDENGRPMHSWRVLLLPFMEQQAIYEQYDLNEPWDGPNNSRLAGMIDNVYRCPSEDTSVHPAETNYVMIVGPGTISDGPTPTQIGQITDGVANTIMVVEVAGSGIHWTEPRDLKLEDAASSLSGGAGNGIGGKHRGVANILFCDGRVDSLAKPIDPNRLKGMTTVAGGENAGGFLQEY